MARANLLRIYHSPCRINIFKLYRIKKNVPDIDAKLFIFIVVFIFYIKCSCMSVMLSLCSVMSKFK